jgi:hypothetical protein
MVDYVITVVLLLWLSTSKSLLSHVHFLMSQQAIDFLEEDYRVDRELGAINAIEAWWIERQEALERAGYMLRPRYRAGWKPSWEGTKKLYFHCEDGQIKVVCVDTCAYWLLYS